MSFLQDSSVTKNCPLQSQVHLEMRTSEVNGSGDSYLTKQRSSLSTRLFHSNNNIGFLNMQNTALEIPKDFSTTLRAVINW